MTLLKNALAFLALGGMITPPVVAADPTQPALHYDSQIRDVALSPHGLFQARVMTRNGVALAGQPVVLMQGGKIVAQPVSDSFGRVHVSRLRGGTYELRMADHLAQVRIWTKVAAPPIATEELLLVADSDVVRAQQPIGNLFCSEPIMIAVLIAAAIAIPIAVHNSGSDNGS